MTVNNGACHRGLTILLSAVIPVVSVAPARAGAGAHPFEFLSLDADARAVALGGAYTALASDANALLYNPAGMGFVERHEAVFMHNQYFEGVTQEYAAFASRRGWGLQLNYLDFGDLPKTTISNKTGAGLGSYGITDMALTGGYARRLGPLALGGSLKYIRESIETVTADGLAFDAGAMWRPEAVSALSLGASLRNVGPDVKFQRSPEKLPTQLRLGGAYTADLRGLPATLSVDLHKKRLEDVVVAAGLETVVAGLLPLRLGYDMRNDAGLGLTAGFGWVHRDVRLDYAFVAFGDLGSAHRVSAAVRWGPGGPERPVREVRRKEPPPPVMEAEAEPPPAALPPPPPAAPGPSIPDVPRHLWPAFHLAKAREALGAGDAARAERHLRDAGALLEEQPGLRLPYLVLRGKASYLREERSRALADWLSAVRTAREAGESGPELAEAHAGIAQCLLADKRDAEASTHLRLALQSHPSEELRARLVESLRALEAKPSWNAEF